MFAIVFPGQGSQSPGMGKDLYEKYPSSHEVFDRVEQSTGVDMKHLCFELEAEELRQTQNAQLALFTCGCAAWKVLQEEVPSIVPQAMAGHSVGEYTALVAAGILSLEEGAKLVQRRGELMARSGNLRPGMMAAVLGTEVPLIEDLCKRVLPFGEVVIANYNCPGQHVISGDKEAVEKWISLAKDAGVKKIISLNVSGAFHSPLMEGPAEAMGKVLSQCKFTDSADGVLVYSNVTTEPVRESSLWSDLLERQLKSPVLWMQSIENMIRDGVKVFIECGSGEILCGLVKRIDPDVKTLAIYDSSSLKDAISEIGFIHA